MHGFKLLFFLFDMRSFFLVWALASERNDLCTIYSPATTNNCERLQQLDFLRYVSILASMIMRLVKEASTSRRVLTFCGLLALLFSACVQGGDGSSVQGTQKETIVPADTRTIKQMEEYEKTHPPSSEKQVMPMPGLGPDQDIDDSFHPGSTGQ